MKNIVVKKGDPAEISLPVDGSPPPEVSWKKDGEPVVPDDRIQQVLSVYVLYFFHLCVLLKLSGFFIVACLFVCLFVVCLSVCLSVRLFFFV